MVCSPILIPIARWLVFNFYFFWICLIFVSSILLPALQSLLNLWWDFSLMVRWPWSSFLLQLWLDVSFHICIYIHVALIFLSTRAHNFSRVKSLGRSIIFCSALDPFFGQEMQFHISLWYTKVVARYFFSYMHIYIHVALIFLSTRAHNFSRVKSLGRSIIFCSTLDTFFSQEMQFHISLWSDTFFSYSFFIEFTLFKYMVTHKALNMILSYSLNAYAILRKWQSLNP